MQTKRLVGLFLATVLVLFVSIQIVFIGVLQGNNEQIASIVKTHLRSELERSEFFRLAVLLRNFEANGVIRCTQVALEKSTEPFLVYKSPANKRCQPNVYLLEGVRSEGFVHSTDGQNWHFSFTSLPPKSLSIFVILVRFLVLLVTSVIFYIFYLRTSQSQKTQDTIDIHMRSIAHDINSPLGGLKTLCSDTSLLKSDRGIELMQKCVVRIASISETILAGEQNISGQRDSFLITNITRQAVEIIQEQFKLEPDNKINVHIVNNLVNVRTQVAGDGEQYKRIIINLINNSKDAYENKSGNIHIDLREGDSKAFIIVEVVDSGKGIPKNIIEKLKQGGIVSTKLTGHGYGLSSAKNLVKSWDGQLKVESNTPPGTRITIHLKVI